MSASSRASLMATVPSPMTAPASSCTASSTSSRRLSPALLISLGQRRESGLSVCLRAGNSAHDRIHPVRQAARRDEDTLEAVPAIGLFVHAFETQCILEADAARCGRL